MGLLEIASSKSAWQGIEYYKSHYVLSSEPAEDGVYDGLVKGSGDEAYCVNVDSVHLRRSKRNCSLANGKKIICKNIVWRRKCF